MSALLALGAVVCKGVPSDGVSVTVKYKSHSQTTTTKGGLWFLAMETR